MKNTLSNLSFYLAVAAVSCGLFYLANPSPTAQPNIQTVNNTTLSSAMTASTTAAVVASVSAFTGAAQAIAVGQELFVDLEAMQVRAISGTTLTVSRGFDGTVAVSHPSAAVVFSGPTNFFQRADPPYGSCTTATMTARPWVNVKNGMIWLCISSVWKATNVQPITYNSVGVY